MYLIQLLLPLYDNSGRRVPHVTFARVRDELTERYGGVTAFLRSPAQGTWKEADGAVDRDEIVMVEVMAEDLDPAWWRDYRRKLERWFGQRSSCSGPLKRGGSEASGTAFAGLEQGGLMASTLDGESSRDRIVDKGHGTGALGPSDTSDSGSDITGGPGLFEGDVIGLDRGTNEDIGRGISGNAGADIGDANLDSDSDSVGTGEHKTAGREPRSGRDIGTDRIESMVPDLGDDEAAGV